MTAVVLPRSRPERTRSHRTRQIEWSLLAGGLFFGMLMLLAIYGPLVAPYDLYFTRALFDGKAAPFPPSATYPFGSDILGRDRLSWLLIGARGSVAIAFSAAGLRVLVGATLGLIAGFRGGVLSDVLRRVALGVSSVPATIATLLAVIALGVSAEQFVFALGLIGWAEPFHQARRYSRSESARPYMESARSVGVSQRRLLFRHLLPNIAPQLLTTAAFQVSAVLLLMAELALLNFFVGGSVVIDYDSRGNAIVAPKVANWASMLAATRPIISLYGDLASVLLPGGALLGAVVAINLFGDALAARAQRMDVYRLFSRRQLVVFTTLALVIAVSVHAWPSRLAAELEYARGFDVSRATQVANQLVALGVRANGSPQAAEAATLLAGAIGGQIVRGTDAEIRVRQSELRIAGTIVPAEAVSVLSIEDASAHGALVYADPQALVASRTMPDVIRGAVVAVPAGPIAVGLGPRLAAGGASAFIILDDTGLNLPRANTLYPLPTLGLRTASLVSAVGRSLPDLRALPVHWVVLASEAALQVATQRVETPTVDIVARVHGTAASGPLVALAARYDAAPGAGTAWDTASATGVLIAVVEQLRREPLDLEVLVILTGGDHQNYAGLRNGLATFDRAERARLQAVVLVGPALSDNLVLNAEVSPGVGSGTGRLASRLADATGASLVIGSSGDLERAIQTAGVATAPLGVSGRGLDRAPSMGMVGAAGRLVLGALAYIPRHQDEMR